MKKFTYLLICAGIFQLHSFAQVQIDKAINLTGTFANAKITGIKDVSAFQDAVSVEALQSGKLITAQLVVQSGCGPSCTLIALTFSPPFSVTAPPFIVTPLRRGTILTFRATTDVAAGTVAINVDGTGNRSLYKKVSTPIEGGEIRGGEMVTIIYDGTNFQLLSGDADLRNEGMLGVLPGSPTSSLITSNTWGATGVTVNAGDGLTISESTSPNGGTITLAVPNAGITKAMLADSAVTVTAGTGLTGGGAISLGGSTTIGLATPVSVSNGGTGTGTAFTPGSVVFAGSGGVFSQNNDSIFWDNANGRLGIGTAAPTSLLEISGKQSTTQMRLKLPAAANGAGTGDVNMQLWVSEPNLAWEGGGIGINITNDGVGATRFSRLNTGLGASYIRFNAYYGTMEFNTMSTGGTYYQTMHMRNGDVGIGTINPSAKLDVEGEIRHNGIVMTDSMWISSYEISTLRYVVEASPSRVGRVLPFDNLLVEQLCHDQDGCNVTIQMINWDGSGSIASRQERLFLGQGIGPWRVCNNDVDGFDLDASTSEWTAWDCYLTDAETSTNANNGRSDSKWGFGLLNVKGGSYSDTSTWCRVVFED